MKRTSRRRKENKLHAGRPVLHRVGCIKAYESLTDHAALTGNGNGSVIRFYLPSLATVSSLDVVDTELARRQRQSAPPLRLVKRVRDGQGSFVEETPSTRALSLSGGNATRSSMGQTFRSPRSARPHACRP